VDASDPLLIAEAIAGMVKHHSEIRSMVDSRRILADSYRITNTTNFLEAAIVGAIDRRRTQSIA
jgi:hypothetical protein